MKNIILFILIFVSFQIKATVYYVSATGSDAANGTTTGTAWQTLTKVNASTFSAGDQILFKKGDTFTGTLTVPSSGSSGNPIIFGAYGTGANPIITGFSTVSSWTNLGSNIWESTNAVSILSTCNVVSINGVLTPMGRYPNSTDTNKGYLTYQSSSSTSITSSSLSGTTNWTGAEVVVKTSNFTIERRTISSQSGGTLNWTTVVDRGPSNGFGFFIQNDSRTLDVQNEWYFNPTTKKIRIYSTTQPTNVKVSTIDKLANVTKNYVTIDGIDFTGANSYAIWNDATDTPAKVYLTVKNCAISFVGTSGISFRGSNILYENNSVSNSNGEGIGTSATSSYVTMRGNTLLNIGAYPGQGSVHSALTSGNYVSNITIENNSISNVGFNGITFHGSNITIKNNFVDTFCQTMDDGGGIYTYTGGETAMSNVVLDGNILINGKGSPEGTDLVFPAIGAGIYCDNKSTGVEIKNNTVYNCRRYGIHLNDATYINVHDNTVFKIWETVSNQTSAGLKFAYPVVNNYYANITINNNTFVASASNEYSLFINSYYDLNIPKFGTANNNIYARPIDDNKTIYADQPSEWSGAKEAKTLSEWKTFSSQDVNSKKSPISVSSESDIQFMYNETNATKIVALTNPSVDMNGTKYVGSITLQPYTSAIYLKDPDPATQAPANKRHPVKSGTKYYKSGGYYYTL